LKKTTAAMAIAAFLLTATSAYAGDWKLIWSDDFNYKGLPDKTKWSYEEGFVRNGEKQYYTRARLENAHVDDGMLTIECRKEHYTPEHHAPVEYTAASLITQGKATFLYGRIEVRAKIPQGKGVWPAIWTLGANEPKVGWPACGENDIMEFVGSDPNHIHGTLHYAVNGKHESDGGALTTTKPYDDFHIYATEWFPDRIDFYFDKQKYRSVPTAKAGNDDKNPFHAPHFLLINFALGGSWGGHIDDSILPQKFLINYVHVYSRSDLPQAAPATQPMPAK